MSDKRRIKANSIEAQGSWKQIIFASAGAIAIEIRGLAEAVDRVARALEQSNGDRVRTVSGIAQEGV